VSLFFARFYASSYKLPMPGMEEKKRSEKEQKKLSERTERADKSRKRNHKSVPEKKEEKADTSDAISVSSVKLPSIYSNENVLMSNGEAEGRGELII
jgi:hypothetical protein